MLTAYIASGFLVETGEESFSKCCMQACLDLVNHKNTIEPVLFHIQLESL